MADSNPYMQHHSLLQSTFPVFLPEMPELNLPQDQFAAHIKSLMPKQSAPWSANLSTHDKPGKGKNKSDAGERSAFMDALASSKRAVPSFDGHDGKMRTENGDVAHSTSGSPLVDLFYELEKVVDEDILKKLLEKSWAHDADATLKIIWNARSIHLGKSDRHCFYRAIGWLYSEHPLTLLSNLQWLVRPVIQKKKVQEKDKPAGNEGATKADDGNDSDATMDFDLVDEDGNTSSTAAGKKRKFSELESADAEFDVKYGVAHGYWKDLLNILVLAATDQLKVGGDPRSALNVEKPNEKKYKRDWTEGRKKDRHKRQHTATQDRLSDDQKYKALHLTVARLFAEQLKLDLARLVSDDKREIKKITLAGKWAPSTKGMHDQHTTIVSSIAELMHPIANFTTIENRNDRETYLKHARNAYQVKTLSKLRKHLQVVERDITAKTFEDIKYDHVPSLAMKQYTPLFANKDFERFDKYLDEVVQGQATISGAVLLPSVLVAEVRGRPRSFSKQSVDGLVAAKLHAVRTKAIGGQWDTLVKRIKDSGTLESSIAICDVSGSMAHPIFKDGTCPVDSAIGLSLLIAEVTKPPFGEAFITFDRHPQFLQVGGAGDSRTFEEKVRYIGNAPWGQSTNFVGVFEKLILPAAIMNEVKQENMVKQVFVFSDMQFNAANEYEDLWTTSYQRIKDQFEKAGYEMPKLIFWNLAGGRAGYDGGSYGNPTAPKPVTADEPGTVLVSGYSQGQLKMFLENGQFKDEEKKVTLGTKDQGEDGEEIVRTITEPRNDSLAALRKAISHEGYRMLKVVD